MVSNLVSKGKMEQQTNPQLANGGNILVKRSNILVKSIPFNGENKSKFVVNGNF